jgi:hypothetical protein
MTKLRFVRPWRGYKSGQVIDVPGGLAAELVARRLAVEDRQQLLETAAIEPVVETANATPKRRGRRAVPKPDATDAAGG